jgi:hypothetical protein
MRGTKFVLRVVWRIAKSILWMVVIFFGLLMLLALPHTYSNNWGTTSDDGGGPQSEKFYGFVNGITFPL